jgi:hypothetical protein
MAKVPEYRQFAADCLRWATEAEQDEDKEALLEMAQDFALAATATRLGAVAKERQRRLTAVGGSDLSRPKTV